MRTSYFIFKVVICAFRKYKLGCGSEDVIENKIVVSRLNDKKTYSFQEGFNSFFTVDFKERIQNET